MFVFSRTVANRIKSIVLYFYDLIIFIMFKFFFYKNTLVFFFVFLIK